MKLFSMEYDSIINAHDCYQKNSYAKNKAWFDKIFKYINNNRFVDISALILGWEVNSYLNISMQLLEWLMKGFKKNLSQSSFI